MAGNWGRGISVVPGRGLPLIPDPDTILESWRNWSARTVWDPALVLYSPAVPVLLLQSDFEIAPGLCGNLWSPGNPAMMTLFVWESKDCLGVRSIGLLRIAMDCLNFATSFLVLYILLPILPLQLHWDCFRIEDWVRIVDYVILLLVLISLCSISSPSDVAGLQDCTVIVLWVCVGRCYVTGGRMATQCVWESEDCSEFRGLLACSCCNLPEICAILMQSNQSPCNPF